MVDDVLHDRDALRTLAYLGDAGQRPASHGRQRAAVQTIAGESMKLLGGGDIYGNALSPVCVDEIEGVGHAFDPRFLDQQGDRFAIRGQGAVDHLGGLGDEQALAGLKPVA